MALALGKMGAGHENLPDLDVHPIIGKKKNVREPNKDVLKHSRED